MNYSEATLNLIRIARNYGYYNNWYIIPATCAFGVITNLICCIIFLLPKFNLKTYRLLFWECLFHLGGLAIQAFSPVVMSYEYIGYAYATMVYRWLFKTWVYNSFCMAALLCNLAVSFDRLIMISKRGNCFMSRIPVLALVAVFFIFSLACFLFPIFAYYIAPADPEYYPDGFFVLYYTDWGQSVAISQIRVTMFCLRDAVLWVIFVGVNILLLYEARKVFRRKANLTAPAASVNAAVATSESTSKSKTSKNLSVQAERRMTYMIVVMSAILAFGQLPYFINIILNARWPGRDNHPDVSSMIAIVNNLALNTLYTSFSVSIFIYYLFDKNFKSTIDTFCKKICFRR